MKKVIPFVIFILCYSTTVFAQEPKIQGNENNVINEFSVSLIKLIATPEKFHGKKIRVMGYLNLEMEGNAIYLHQEDYENHLFDNSFWVSFSRKINNKNLRELNKGYVLIEGTFDMNNKGHMGIFGGEIKDITRIEKFGK